jgi:hypothetical protein
MMKRSNLYLPLIFVISFSFACKNKKEVTETQKPMPVEQADSKPTMEEEFPVKTQKQRIKFPENAIARIQRTACFGHCPIYTLTVYNDGTAMLHAEKWLDLEGDFTATVDQKKFDNLIQKAEEVGYFELKDVYDSESVTDLPSTITTLRKGDELKQIVNRYQGPDDLDDFEKYFDELYLKLDWKETE